MTKEEVWQSLAFCAVCGQPVALEKPIVFNAPKEQLPAPMVSDGKRAIWGAMYFRDPFHNPSQPFVNYCGPVCANQEKNDASAANR